MKRTFNYTNILVLSFGRSTGIPFEPRRSMRLVILHTPIRCWHSFVHPHHRDFFAHTAGPYLPVTAPVRPILGGFFRQGDVEVILATIVIRCTIMWVPLVNAAVCFPLWRLATHLKKTLSASPLATFGPNAGRAILGRVYKLFFHAQLPRGVRWPE